MSKSTTTPTVYGVDSKLGDRAQTRILTARTALVATAEAVTEAESRWNTAKEFCDDQLADARTAQADAWKRLDTAKKDVGCRSPVDQVRKRAEQRVNKAQKAFDAAKAHADSVRSETDKILREFFAVCEQKRSENKRARKALLDAQAEERIRYCEEQEAHRQFKAQLRGN
jgi:hypothetical protein